MVKALFVLGKSKFLSSFFGYVEKRLDNKAKISFKIFDFRDWTTSPEVKATRQSSFVSQ